jgi:hypothetical protein
MASPRVNRILDTLHRSTVAVILVSTGYFAFEAMRANWAIQKWKYEQRVSILTQMVKLTASRQQPLRNHTHLWHAGHLRTTCSGTNAL